MNSIPNFFIEIMYKYCQLAILKTLGMLDNPHQKSQSKFVGNVHAFLHAKKATSSLISFLGYCKEIAHLLFWVIWAYLAT